MAASWAENRLRGARSKAQVGAELQCKCRWEMNLLDPCGYRGSNVATGREIIKDNEVGLPSSRWVGSHCGSPAQTSDGLERNDSHCGDEETNYCPGVIIAYRYTPSLFVVQCKRISLTPGILNTLFLK